MAGESQSTKESSVFSSLDGHRIVLTHPQKVLFPDAGVTKRELAEYYRDIAPVMLPYIRRRPVMMARYPHGVGKPGFYQKDVAGEFPKWIKRVRVRKEGGTVEHAFCNTAASLIYLLEVDSITPHVWLSTTKNIRMPDRMIFDLDPNNVPFRSVCAVAKELRSILVKKGFRPFVMTTGSKGFHITVPIKPTRNFDAVRLAARRIAQEHARAHPELVTMEQRKAKRGKRVFIDIMRNAYAQTAVPPYAVRARPNAPIATPLFWRELDSAELRSDLYTVRNIFRRLQKVGDPWKGMQRHRVALHDDCRDGTITVE